VTGDGCVCIVTHSAAWLMRVLLGRSGDPMAIPASAKTRLPGDLSVVWCAEPKATQQETSLTSNRPPWLYGDTECGQQRRLLQLRLCFGSSDPRVSGVLFTVSGIVISAQADCFGNIHDASRLCATCIPILVATSILGMNPVSYTCICLTSQWASFYSLHNTSILLQTRLLSSIYALRRHFWPAMTFYIRRRRYLPQRLVFWPLFRPF
jgi:hypothetical protein